jgi:hypothetical protein
MITKDNLHFCFDNLQQKEIKEAFESPMEYLEFELSHCNAGAFSTIKPSDFCYEKDHEALINGQQFIHKDDFLELFKESVSVNPFLLELI